MDIHDQQRLYFIFYKIIEEFCLKQRTGQIQQVLNSFAESLRKIPVFVLNNKLIKQVALKEFPSVLKIKKYIHHIVHVGEGSEEERE